MSADITTKICTEDKMRIQTLQGFGLGESWIKFRHSLCVKNWKTKFC